MNVINVIDNDGIRIDKYLLDKLDISRNKIQKLINDNNILVNGKSVKTSYIVRVDDLIECDFLYKEKIDILPEDIPLDIVYEDDDLLVVNNPSCCR